MRLRDKEVMIKEGDEEVHIMLFEPKSTVNTGNIRSEKTVKGEWI